MPTVYGGALRLPGGMNVAERFLANTDSSFNDLAEQPKLSAQLKLKNPSINSAIPHPQ